MMIANAACALFFASLAIAGFLEAMTYGHLLLVALLTGTATVFFQAAYHSYLPTVLAEADLVEGNSKIQGAEAATRVIGPSVGGWWLQLSGSRPVWLSTRSRSPSASCASG